MARSEYRSSKDGVLGEGTFPLRQLEGLEERCSKLTSGVRSEAAATQNILLAYSYKAAPGDDFADIELLSLGPSHRRPSQPNFYGQGVRTPTGSAPMQSTASSHNIRYQLLSLPRFVFTLLVNDKKLKPRSHRIGRRNATQHHGAWRQHRPTAPCVILRVVNVC